MNLTRKHFLFIGFLVLLAFPGWSQGEKRNTFGNGIRVLNADSTFSMNFSVRIQSQYRGDLNVETNEYEDGFQVRRSRLKFSGFAYSPKLTYKIELAIANSDTRSGQIPQSGNTPNIVLDAYVKWNFWRRWSLIFGQKKLPGNRERVISSQELQFVDRSNLNSDFNIDRDAGVHLLYEGPKVNLIGAFTMGEGRNMIVENTGGHDVTLRAEYLPFGQFINEGDYFGSDLAREPTPKLSLAVSYDFNNNASRTGGQLGDFLPETRNLSTVFADAHFKYRGFSSMIEYVDRNARDGAAVYDVEGNFFDAFQTGQGFNWQAGYLFKNNFEVAGRYTVVNPEAITGRPDAIQYTLGFSRYFVGHNLKVQTDISYTEEDFTDDMLMYRLQVELAF